MPISSSHRAPDTLRSVAIWGAVGALAIVPLAVAATSPLLAWREASYIISGLSGALALSILLLQPLLAGRVLPGVHPLRARRWHRWLGAGLIACVAAHVIGLYVTSPPDTMDALLLVSPTPFSIYGVVGMWTLVITGLLVAFRRRLRMHPARWRIIHNGLAVVVVVCSVVHALLIEGTMGAVTKWALCLGVLAAAGFVIGHLRIIKPMRKARR